MSQLHLSLIGDILISNNATICLYNTANIQMYWAFITNFLIIEVAFDEIPTKAQIHSPRCSPLVIHSTCNDPPKISVWSRKLSSPPPPLSPSFSLCLSVSCFECVSCKNIPFVFYPKYRLSSFFSRYLYPRGGTAIYGPYRYVPLWRVWFSSSLLDHRVYKSERLGLE